MFKHSSVSIKHKMFLKPQINSVARKHCKLVQELNELSCILMKQMNKPDEDYTDHIMCEIGDVYYRLNEILDYYDRDAIQIYALSKKNTKIS